MQIKVIFTNNILDYHAKDRLSNIKKHPAKAGCFCYVSVNFSSLAL